MRYEWDETKRRANLRRHGFDFVAIEKILSEATVTFLDDRFDYGETRLQTVGFLADRMVMVIWTPRDEARHIISMRKCNDREKAIYQKRFSQG